MGAPPTAAIRVSNPASCWPGPSWHTLVGSRPTQAVSVAAFRYSKRPSWSSMASRLMRTGRQPGNSRVRSGASGRATRSRFPNGRRPGASRRGEAAGGHTPCYRAPPLATPLQKLPGRPPAPLSPPPAPTLTRHSPLPRPLLHPNLLRHAGLPPLEATATTTSPRLHDARARRSPRHLAYLSPKSLRNSSSRRNSITKSSGISSFL